MCEATRPGSRQQVIELEHRARRASCKASLPLPAAAAAMRTRIGDAPRGLAADSPPGLIGSRRPPRLGRGYAGAQTPAHLTTVEFYTAAARLLAPDGVLLVNVADGAGPRATRGGRSPRSAPSSSTSSVLAEVQVLKGRRFGNLVVARLERPAADRVAAPPHGRRVPHPAKVAHGAELDEFTRARAGDGRRCHPVTPARGIRLRPLRTGDAGARRALFGAGRARAHLERRVGRAKGGKP